MKKIAMMMMAFTLIFSAVSTMVLFSADTAAEAKSYKSGKKGFKPNQNNFQKNKDSNSSNVTKTTKDNTSAKKGGFSSGGLMRGLFVGGLAGLLFGSLFAEMGLLGNILGFIINVGAILLVFYLALKIYFTMKRKHEATNQWRS